MNLIERMKKRKEYHDSKKYIRKDELVEWLDLFKNKMDYSNDKQAYVGAFCEIMKFNVENWSLDGAVIDMDLQVQDLKEILWGDLCSRI